MNTLIRHASTLDVPALVAMGERFRTNSKYRNLLGSDEASAAQLAHTLIERADTSTILVADATNSTDNLDSRLVGMLGLATYRHPMSGEHVAGELFWWVDVEYRGVTGVKLLRRAEEWSKSRGARRLYMIAPDVSVETLYTRLGYDRVEVSYQKELV